VAATVYEVTGHDEASPIGATLFVDGGSRSGAYTGTMSATPAETSVVISGAVEDEGTLTGGTDWTQDYNVTNDGYMHNVYQHRVGATNVAYNVITTSYSFAVVGIEIRARAKEERFMLIMHY
jgi:hypothetical protein